MSARLTHCRDPYWFGGSGFALSPPLNAAAQTWTISTDTPAGTGGYSGPKPAIQKSGSIYAASAAAEPNGSVLVSTDSGSTWTAESVPSTYSSVFAVCNVGGRVLAFCEDYAYTQGAPWTPYNSTKFYVSPLSVFVSAQMQVAYGAGICVLFTGNSKIYYRSTDGGLTWSSYDLPFPSPASTEPSLLWDGTQFVAIIETSDSAIEQIATSTDGLTWEQVALSSTPSGLEMLSAGGGIYAAATATEVLIADSVAGLQSASLVDPFPGKDIASIAVLADGRVILELTDGTMHTSANVGKTWVSDTVAWSAFSATQGPISPLGNLALASVSYTSGNGAWGQRTELC